MTCQNCKNWNAKLLTCELNPDVKRDKNGTCAKSFCPICGLQKEPFAGNVYYCSNCDYQWSGI